MSERDTYYHAIGNVDIAVNVEVERWEESDDRDGSNGFYSVKILSLELPQLFKKSRTNINLKAGVVAEIQGAVDEYYREVA